MGNTCIVSSLGCLKKLYSLCGIVCIVREAEPVWDTCFLAVPAARTHFFNILAPGTIGEMGLHPTKLEKMARSAVILRISITKRHVAAGTNSLSTTNEKRTTKAQQNLLKREQSKPEHKAAKRNIEVGMIDLHRIQAAYIPVNPRQPTFPRRSGHLRVDEVESRGWGRRAPQSPSSSSFGAPQGNNEIYKCDAVFLIEKAKINDQSQTQIPYKCAARQQ